MRRWQFINTSTWNASDNITVKNIVSYGEDINDLSSDILGTGWQAPNGTKLGLVWVTSAPGTHLNDQSTFTEELQFQGNSLDGRLQWIVGGYYEKSRTLGGGTGTLTENLLNCNDPRIGEFNVPLPNGLGFVQPVDCATPFGGGKLSTSLRSTVFEGFGVFSQATYDITDTLSFTGGIRYTEDRSRAVDTGIDYVVANLSALGVPGASIVNAPRIGRAPTCSSANLPYPNCTASAKTNTSAPTWLLNANYKPNSNTLFYVKYARGYKQGMVNPRALEPYKQFGPEKLDAYEAGAKISWQGDLPGYVNVAAYYNDFSKQQFRVSWTSTDGTNTTSAIVNTASSRGYGFEFDGGISLSDKLRLTGAFAYTNAELKEVSVPPGPLGFPNVNDAGTPGAAAPRSPKWKGAVSAKYTLPVPEALGEATAGISWSYSGSYYSSYDVLSKIKSFDIFNLNLDWKDIGGQSVDLGLFVNNLTNKKYYVFSTALEESGFVSSYTGQPRMFGAQLKVRFGADAQ